MIWYILFCAGVVMAMAIMFSAEEVDAGKGIIVGFILGAGFTIGLILQWGAACP